ncbi:hypoxanthine phosphoribosyltransferase [Thecamonas trahens ATCC 50062]|uniref:Hypoxanthine phosphoribosyltransferase n=1 Tax=Thecamonas trahens ATCC 50062 TaxID=461836 RepID=A0A0L0DRA1_THETB|nr:hypoxanthine phosphoribosyltransferase [Thecamonas trahens ATCC 50062]KNC54777.1 hypoxanthine phosphoribosyltransferase [Thecamonas trahens ATCC 50062]|eukprot:XP_013761677.1 hypoxanthine phosphoribosyltransferase [Thecamonas trahens ATCC 50062]
MASSPTSASVMPEMIVIPDDYEAIPVSLLSIPTRYQGDVDSCLIPFGLITDRVQKLAEMVYEQYKGKELHMLCLLKGAYRFFSDLLKEISALSAAADAPDVVKLSLHFVRVKSYHNTESTGDVKISGIDLDDLAGKNVLIVEDIIDTGTTMVAFTAELQKVTPASVEVISLLVKRTPRSNGFLPHYAGFSIPDKFLVGYALDLNEVFRDLNHICIISEAGIEKYRE